MTRIHHPQQVFTERENPPHHMWSYCPVCAANLQEAESGVAECSSDTCTFKFYRNPVPAVSILVEDGGRVLVVRRNGKNVIGADKWCLPCGYVDHGEDFLSAARREVFEESGLTVRIEGLLSTVSNAFGPHMHSLVVVLLARPIGGELRAGDDAVEARWANPDEQIGWAFQADAHIVARYFEAPFAGAPVDTRFSG